MLRSILIFIALSLFARHLQAQDAATTEGQVNTEHHTRFFEGTPTRKLSKKLPSFQIENQKFSMCSPTIYDGVAYIGTDSGEVVTVTSSEINRKYHLENAGAIEGAPAVTKENVFVGYKNNFFAAFSRADGKLLWKYETKGPIATTPLAHDKLVYFTTTNGYCYALNIETGTFKWRFNVLSKASSPAYDKDVIYVGNDRQCIYAINAKNGDQIWQYIGAGGQPVVGDLYIYGVEKVGSVVAINKPTGQRDWHFKGYLIEGSTELAVTNDIIVFGNATTIVAIDCKIKNGFFKWKKELKRSLASAPIIVGNIVYAVCLDGSIYTLDIGYGDEMSKFELGFTPNSSPAFGKELVLSNGGEILFVGGE